MGRGNLDIDQFRDAVVQGDGTKVATAKGSFIAGNLLKAGTGGAVEDSGVSSVSGGGGGTAAYVVYSSNTNISTSLYATKGNIILTDYNLTLRAVCVRSAGAGGTFKVVIAAVNDSDVITEILATSDSKVVGAVAFTTFLLPSPVSISGGSRFAVLVVITSGTPTTSCPICVLNTDLGQGPGLTHIGPARAASVDPQVGDSLTWAGGGAAAMSFLCDLSL